MPITDIVKIAISVADLITNPIIGTSLVGTSLVKLLLNEICIALQYYRMLKDTAALRIKTASYKYIK